MTYKTPDELRKAIKETTAELKSLKGQLEHLEASCTHEWTEPTYTPDIREGYYSPGDPPGTMGVDRQLPCHIPRQVTPKWTRTCKKCGKVETTQRTDEKITKTPRF